MDRSIHNLSDDEIKQLAQCQSSEEVVGMLGNAGVSLPDELLEDVAGGGKYIWEWPVWKNVYKTIKDYIDKKM